MSGVGRDGDDLALRDTSALQLDSRVSHLQFKIHSIGIDLPIHTSLKKSINISPYTRRTWNHEHCYICHRHAVSEVEGLQNAA